MQTFFEGPFENGLFRGEEWKNRSAMVVVPHQDDEINLAGATIRNLVQNHVRVYVVFCTTCDRLEPAEMRAAEGIRSCRSLGVTDDDIIFLGYSNGLCASSGESVYNAAEDGPVTNERQRTETFDAGGRPEWHWLRSRTHHGFCRKNIREDLTDVLLTLRPDIIFAVDFDRHPDHRVFSLLFEEALGNILRQPDNAWFPEIYKGFAYNGSFLGARDFYSFLNLKGEVQAEKDYSNNLAFDTDFPPYVWAERVRLPLPAHCLSRTLNGNGLYGAVRAHFSQGMLHNAKRIFNSDQVFWRRRTDALSYKAAVTATSGDPACLTDFKLADSSDVNAHPAYFDAGVWIPEAGDSRREVRMEFDSPQPVVRVTLHGNAESDSRVLKGLVRLSDGSEFPFGPLPPGGREYHIDFPLPHCITWLTLKLLETAGPAAGLAELQVYGSLYPQTQLRFLKLMVRDTFAYDYWVRDRQEIPLQLYRYDSRGVRVAEDAVPDDCMLLPVEPGGYELEGLRLRPGAGFRQAVLRVVQKDDPSVYDQIIIRRVSLPRLLQLRLVQGLDAFMNRMEHVIKTKYYKWFIRK